MCQQCSKAPETRDHIVFNCPITKLDVGYATVHNSDEDLGSLNIIWRCSHVILRLPTSIVLLQSQPRKRTTIVPPPTNGKCRIPASIVPTSVNIYEEYRLQLHPLNCSYFVQEPTSIAPTFVDMYCRIQTPIVNPQLYLLSRGYQPRLRLHLSTVEYRPQLHLSTEPS
ncbi:hypothetical protein ElyMa_002362500 [Elysia marginata]|uniref:Reverse transcriptase zinc-binding domain-containing protein n=1 Tax=Elysia marginata TaxID=1093978 RepID=A0AAV4GA79_9GAST|nr:hypothetical protein ElyMa_002362500 [Elysia marginata]